MTVIHTSTRESLGLSASAPSSVTSYSATITVEGIQFPTTIIDGTAGADSITGSSAATYIFGFGGNDTISNSGSAAVLLGGEGSDTFVMYNNSTLAAISDGSILDFEVGSDRIDLSNYSVSSFSDLTITNNTEGVAGSFASIENAAANLKISVSSTGGLNNLTASSFVFDGESGSDTTSGGGDTTVNTPVTFTIPKIGTFATIASEVIEGTSGADTLFGGAKLASPDDGADTITGGDGSDFIFGNGGADVLYGGSTLVNPNDAADTIFGGVGNDTIYGNGGDDFINGQIGDDFMHGGVGSDTYAFTADSGNDIIAYFQGAGISGGDIIQIASDVNGSGITTAALAAAAVSYADGNATLDLGGGNTVLIMNISSGSMTSGDFAIV